MYSLRKVTPMNIVVIGIVHDIVCTGNFLQINEFHEHVYINVSPIIQDCVPYNIFGKIIPLIR